MQNLITNLQPILDTAPNIIVTYGIKILLAIAVYVIGKSIVKTLADLIERTLSKRNVDPTVASFTRNIAYYALYTMVIIAALGQLGLQTASFVAIFGAAGLAVGFALQGSLSNFAAGVLIILFRPFKNGDFVEAGGTCGVIHEISIFSTVFKTLDNKTVIVSNSAISSGNIVNYSTEPLRRVDFTVGVSYSANIERVKQELLSIAETEIRVLKDRDITIAVAELGDSSVNFAFRVWVDSTDYWPVFFDLNEKIKIQFDAKGIEIPFPQMDVNIHTHKIQAA